MALTPAQIMNSLIPHSSQALVAVTVDLHQWDDPFDITFSAEWLARAEIRATYFVTSAMFLQKDYAERLRDFAGFGHEVGSHSHLHDPSEMKALVRGKGSQLRFLEHSKNIYEDFYGISPRSFRSPCWCRLGPDALDELQRLGYTVDSSSTPQRLSFTGSYPYEGSWFFALRRLRYIRPGLLEVPTSTFLVPASSTAFRIMRGYSMEFARTLLWEALNFSDRVVTLEFHPEDFNPDSKRRWIWHGLKPRDFLLRRVGGLGFRHYLQDSSYQRISERTRLLLRLMSGHRTATLTEIDLIMAVGRGAVAEVTPLEARTHAGTGCSQKH
jgi:hypothetical protein